MKHEGRSRYYAVVFVDMVVAPAHKAQRPNGARRPLRVRRRTQRRRKHIIDETSTDVTVGTRSTSISTVFRVEIVPDALVGAKAVNAALASCATGETGPTVLFVQHQVSTRS